MNITVEQLGDRQHAVDCEYDPYYWIVGDPEGRRVAEYRKAAELCGGISPNCIGWSDIVQHGTGALARIPKGARLRIDSFGQRDDTLAALIRFGGGNELPEHCEVRSLHAQYRGIQRVMEVLRNWLLLRTDVRADLDPFEICVMFDKWKTHCVMPEWRPATQLLSEEPDGLEAELRDFMQRSGSRVFIKPRYASSASGVCYYRVAHGAGNQVRREQLIAAIELERRGEQVRLFNSLRVRSYTAPRDVRDILRTLAPQGTIVEAAINKARVDGDRFDLRVMVVAGQASHIVVRQSSSPLTNLHLGNRRGCIESVANAVGCARIEQCRELAVKAANEFPNALHCGVDVLLPQRGEPVVCELNAFGDLLPNLMASGLSVYETIYRASPVERPCTNCT